MGEGLRVERCLRHWHTPSVLAEGAGHEALSPAFFMCASNKLWCTSVSQALPLDRQGHIRLVTTLECLV